MKYSRMMLGTALLALGFLCMGTVNLFAQDAAAPEEKPAAVYSFDVPEKGTVEEYLEAFQTVRSTRPDPMPETNADFEAYQTALYDALSKIVNNGLAADPKPTDEQFAQLATMKLQILAAQANADEKKLVEFEKYIVELKENKTYMASQFAQLLLPRMEGMVPLLKFLAVAEKEGTTVEEFKKSLDTLIDFAVANPSAAGVVSEIAQPVQLFAEKSGKKEMTKEIFTEITKKFNDSGKPELKAIAQGLEGTVRFQTLPGNTMELKGLKLDGTEFDLASIKDTVVIVDFWATWCGPCIAEMEHLKKLYDEFGGKGLEIVGYSVDRDVDALKKFVEEKKTPWIILSETMSTEKEMTNYSNFYGVRGIPTVVLIGKDGKVIASKRGEALVEATKKLMAE